MPSNHDDVAVRLDNVSKRFLLNPERPGKLRDVVLHPTMILRQFLGRQPFWALRDISLSAKRGEILGIMGANGSGKTTLLRILASISAPTSGTVSIHGRYAAVLELGAGLHPNATGRENAYLNALFMGLSKTDAKQRLPEMIEFAGLEAFADQPVRTYSSGMKLRLGFAVAVHTMADILLIDEILAVGDAAFQEKCLDHFAAEKDRGVTIVLVSHNLAMLRDFADRVILLENGRIAEEGDPGTVIQKYLQRVMTHSPAVMRQFARALRMQGIIEDDEGESEPASAASGERGVD